MPVGGGERPPGAPGRPRGSPPHRQVGAHAVCATARYSGPQQATPCYIGPIVASCSLLWYGRLRRATGGYRLGVIRARVSDEDQAAFAAAAAAEERTLSEWVRRTLRAAVRLPAQPERSGRMVEQPILRPPAPPPTPRPASDRVGPPARRTDPPGSSVQNGRRAGGSRPVEGEIGYEPDQPDDAVREVDEGFDFGS